MRYFPLVFLLFIQLFSCRSDQVEEGSEMEEEPEISRYDDQQYRWGYSSTSGQLVIPAEYDEVRNFSPEGRALVRRGAEWHFIDRRNRVRSAAYTLAWSYREGLARVQAENDSIGFINTRDRMVVPATYTDAGDFRDGYAWVRRGENYGVIDQAGALVVPLQYERLSPAGAGEFIFQREGLFGLLSVDSSEIIPPAYERLKPFGAKELTPARQKGKYGYINRANEWVLPPAYVEAGQFQEERAVVRDEDDQLLLVDEEGTNFLREDYRQLFYGGEGRWVVEKEERFGAVDAEGAIIIPLQFGELQPASDGFMVYRTGPEQWGYLYAEDGSMLTPPAYGLAWPFHNGLARVVTGRGFSLIDTTGNITFPPQYLDIRDGAEGLVPVQVYEPR